MMQTFEPPEAFDLREFLHQRGESPTNFEVSLLFAEKAWQWARRSVPADLEEEKSTKSGVRVRFTFENVDYLARWLLRFGADVKVIEPKELKDAHCAIAGEILGLYG